jgi:hypothetical protein
VVPARLRLLITTSESLTGSKPPARSVGDSSKPVPAWLVGPA